jgi:membrane protease YdiL (CAAX protease family)
MLDKRIVWSYCLIVFGVAWALQLGAILTVGDLEDDAAAPWLIGTMFVPGLTALLLIAIRRDARRLLLWRPRWSVLILLPVAVLVPTAVAFGVVAIAVALDWGASGWFQFAPAGVTIGGGPWVLGVGDQSWMRFLANVAATGLVFALLNGMVAAGEELGWRGFLQGALIERFGTLRAIVLLGFLWSMWHLPAQLAGYNFPDHPILGSLLLSPLELIAASLFLGWLTIRTGSFWLAAVAHGAVNSIQEGVTANLELTVPRLYEDLTTLALYALVGLVFAGLLARKSPMYGATPRQPGAGQGSGPRLNRNTA